MDEPGAYCPGAVRLQERSSDNIFGLLRSWDGHIRNHQRECSFPQGHRPDRFFKVVVKGEHPPQGVKFVKSLWGMLERCWASGPNDRPSIKDVLRCLEMVPNSSEPHSPGADEGMDKDGDEAMDEDGDDWDSGMNSSGSGSDDFFTTNDRAPIPIFFPRPPAPDSFALPSNRSGRKWWLKREEKCSFCQGNDNGNKQGQPELVVTCFMCGRSGVSHTIFVPDPL